jgi:hypothetical protein
MIVGIDHAESGLTLRVIDAALAARPDQMSWIDYSGVGHTDDRGVAPYWAVRPPSRTSVVPVQKRASSERRYIAAATSSSGRPMRPTGKACMRTTLSANEGTWRPCPADHGRVERVSLVPFVYRGFVAVKESCVLAK